MAINKKFFKMNDEEISFFSSTAVGMGGFIIFFMVFWGLIFLGASYSDKNINEHVINTINDEQQQEIDLLKNEVDKLKLELMRAKDPKNNYKFYDYLTNN